MQPHEDPLDEAKRTALQSVSVLSTVGEAAARFAAVSIQQTAAKKERAAGREEAAETAAREARRLADEARVAREKVAARYDGSWIKTATLREAAEVWRDATVYATTGDPVARKVADLALNRLGELHPQWREAYERNVRAGRSAPDAARDAAREVWESAAATVTRPSRGARPHGGGDLDELRAGANGRALPAGGQALNDLDAAVRAETVKLLGDVSPEALDRLQRDLRASGRTPAADGIGLARQYVTQARAEGLMPDVVADAADQALLARANEERARARSAAGAVDDPSTVVDENTIGQVTAAREYGAADHDAAEAQQKRWGNTFAPLRVGGRVDPVVANKQPATVVQAQVRGVTR
ncbi:hypothetical protein AB0B10_25705 [Micromonospora arborensis]|uniref:hypothetical protein n=1 Tax=Micromonospora arborensis TaxID=2116518 RepID=UPI0033FB28B1